MPTTDRRKRVGAEDVAHALADGADVALSASDIDRMSDVELFDWLEALGYEWAGVGWSISVEAECP